MNNGTSVSHPGPTMVAMPLISADTVIAPSATFRVPVSRLLLLPNIPAGMDFGVIGGLLKRMRTTADDWDPILVRPEPGELWRVIDGRHRYFAAVIAGRPDVLAIDETRSMHG
jgi:hypothetical protein